LADARDQQGAEAARGQPGGEIRALPVILHPIAADDILMTKYQVRPASAARTA